jgi:hypothetical protein
VLRTDEDTRAVARYILENPVRAGLVMHPSEYPHLGSDVWTLKELLGSLTLMPGPKDPAYSRCRVARSARAVVPLGLARRVLWTRRCVGGLTITRSPARR